MSSKIGGQRPRPRVALLGTFLDQDMNYFRRIFPTIWPALDINSLRESVDKREIDLIVIAQVINDESGETLAYISTSDFKKGTPKERAEEAGQKIAQDAKKKKIKNVVFDRGGFFYTGNIKVFADSARSAGLIF